MTPETKNPPAEIYLHQGHPREVVVESGPAYTRYIDTYVTYGDDSVVCGPHLVYTRLRTEGLESERLHCDPSQSLIDLIEREYAAKLAYEAARALAEAHAALAEPVAAHVAAVLALTRAEAALAADTLADTRVLQAEVAKTEQAIYRAASAVALQAASDVWSEILAPQR